MFWTITEGVPNRYKRSLISCSYIFGSYKILRTPIGFVNTLPIVRPRPRIDICDHYTHRSTGSDIKLIPN